MPLATQGSRDLSRTQHIPLGLETKPRTFQLPASNGRGKLRIHFLGPGESEPVIEAMFVFQKQILLTYWVDKPRGSTDGLQGHM